jgi:putative ABC transport system permease protein
MIVGASCGLKQGTSMNIYGRSFQVAEVLEEYGLGYDQSIFISYDAADEITASPEYAAYFGERRGLSSMLLIAAEKDADIEALSRALSGEFRDVSLYSTDVLVAELKKQADYFRVSGF